MYIVIGVAGFMYARTRLPTFAARLVSCLRSSVRRPVHDLPRTSGSMNGATPSGSWRNCLLLRLHWMFVFFGWFSLAVFGVALQILGRWSKNCARL